MASPVIIKGNRYGIVLVLDKEMPFPRLCDKIRMKFKESNKFFDSDVQMAISFEGRKLTSEEQEHIIEIINDSCDLDISYIIDNDDSTERIFEQKIREIARGVKSDETKQETDSSELETTLPKPQTIPSELLESSPEPEEDTKETIPKADAKDMDLGEDMGHFYRGTLRSGQSIEFASSIVIIGDVNPGAKVVAKGNIIVIGSLKGSAYAGVNGKPNSFIIALDMDPMQLRIGDLYARSPDTKKLLGLKKKKQVVKEMQIAFVENNNIYIEPINRSVLSNII